MACVFTSTAHYYFLLQVVTNTHTGTHNYFYCICLYSLPLLLLHLSFFFTSTAYHYPLLQVVQEQLKAETAAIAATAKKSARKIEKVLFSMKESLIAFYNILDCYRINHSAHL